MSGSPRFKPGEVVTAQVLDRDRGNKRRPVILLTERPSGWIGLPVSSQSHTLSGGERVPVPDPDRCGLHRSSFLWATGPVALSPGEVIEHVGWVTDAVVDAVAEMVHRSPWELYEMRPQARRDRARGRRRAG